MSITRPALTCLALLAVAACQPAGYYDSNGEYRSYGASDSFNHNHAMADTPDTGHYPDSYGSSTTVVYDHPGYYDSNGVYTTDAPHVPYSMMPGRGMCRIWYPGRSYEYQPTAFYCSGSGVRAPEGAFVVYGG